MSENAAAAAEKKIPFEQLPNECDALQKKQFDLPFDVIVSSLIGLMKVLVRRTIEKVTGVDKRVAELAKRVTELEAFRDMVIQAHEAMQAEAEAAKTAAPTLAVVKPTSANSKAAKAAEKAAEKAAHKPKDGGAA